MALSVVDITTATTGGASATSLDIAAPAGTRAGDLQIIIGANVSATSSSGYFDWSALASEGWKEFRNFALGSTSSSNTSTPGALMMFHRTGPTGMITLPVFGAAGRLTAIRITLRSDSGRFGVSGALYGTTGSSATSQVMPKTPTGVQYGSANAEENLWLGAPGLILQVMAARIASPSSSLTVTGSSPTARVASGTTEAAVWTRPNVRTLPQTTLNCSSSGTFITLTAWFEDPADVPPPTTASLEGEYLITGPLGDPSPFATTNFPGGVVEPGWPRGLRHGYVQIEEEGFLTHHSSYYDSLTEIRAGTVVPIDCTYSVAIGKWEDYPQDVIKAALLKRVDDSTLVDVVRDYVIDPTGVESEAHPTLDACLMSFEDDIAHIAVAYYSWGAYMAHPQNWSLRIAVLKVDLTGDGPAFSVSAYSDGLMYVYGTDGIHRLIALSPTRLAMAYLHDVTDPSQLFIRGDGSEATAPDFHRIAVTAFDFNPELGQLTAGQPKMVGERWAGANLCRVSDSRFVLVTMDETRAELKDRLKIPGTNSFYRGGLHVRTCDVAEDLTITENVHNSSINADPRAGFNAGKAAPFMLNDRLVVAFPVSANFTPQYVLSRNPATGVWEASPGIKTSVLETFNTDGKFVTSTFPWTATQLYTESFGINVGMKLFTLTDSGGVEAASGPTHILDAAAVAWKNQDYFTGQSSDGVLDKSRWIDPIHADVVNGEYAFVSWLMPYTGEGIIELSRVYRGTTVYIDDTSPTGLRASGYRHLGVEGFIGDGYGIQDLCRPRHLPGTNYMISWIPVNSLLFVDGNIEGGVTMEGYPENFYQEDDFGYYHVTNNATILWDDWDMENQVDLRQYGEYPTTGSWGSEFIPNRHGPYYDQIMRVTLWDMTHKPPGAADISDRQVRIMRGKAKR